jgi:hypothetical protein
MNLQAQFRTLDSAWGAGPLADQFGVAAALWWLPGECLTGLWFAQGLLILVVLFGLLFLSKAPKSIHFGAGPSF